MENKDLIEGDKKCMGFMVRDSKRNILLVETYKEISPELADYLLECRVIGLWLRHNTNGADILRKYTSRQLRSIFN